MCATAGLLLSCGKGMQTAATCPPGQPLLDLLGVISVNGTHLSPSVRGRLCLWLTSAGVGCLNLAQQAGNGVLWVDLDLLHQVLCLLAILEPGAQQGVLPFCLQVVDPVQQPACAQLVYEGGQRQQAYNMYWQVLAEPEFGQTLQGMQL